MGELFKARMSDGLSYLIEVQRYAIGDYRARVSTKGLLGPLTEDKAKVFINHAYGHDWADLHSCQTQAKALNFAIERLAEMHQTVYLAEVSKINEPTRVDLQANLAKALDTVVALEERCTVAESSALQSAQFADEYRKKLRSAQEELQIAVRCAVDMNDQREQVESFVASVAKGEA